jgi:putative ABC transport system permease protein
MIRNYFVVAYRNLVRNKVFTFINMFGLATGIAVFILIFQYVAFEWNANRFHKNYSTLYRTAISTKEGAQFYVPPGFAPLAKQKITGIENATRYAEGLGGGVISFNGRNNSVESFREENMPYVDGNFFDVFSFPLVDGTKDLSQPKSMAISENMALKLFGNSNAAGKNVTISNQFGNTIYTIAAVYKQMPASSDIKSEVLLSLSTLNSAANRDQNDWADPATLNSSYSYLYLQLNQNANAANISAQLTQLLRASIENKNTESIVLQPFSEMHLAPSFSYPYETFGSLPLVASLAAVALLIIIIAWTNYINLSTVQSFKRAKETGVRKVLGASRKQLSLQFLTETLLITLAALAPALLLVQLLQPLFNNFTGKPLSIGVLNTPAFLLTGLAIMLAGSLLSGAYVSFILSGYKPAAVIRGKIASQTNGLSLRKGLVVFQFSISIFFIAATIIMYQQLRYMKTNNMGINLNQLLVIKGPTVSSDGQAEKNYAFKNALAQLPFVKKYAASNNVPGIGYNFSAAGITSLNPQTGDDKKSYHIFICDNHFFGTYDIGFAQGATFSENDANNGWNKAQKVILNKKAATALGLNIKENLVGKKISWGKEFEIVGVINDYHHLSLHQAIEPVIYLPSVSFVYFTIKTDEANMQRKIATLNDMYKKAFPGNPFEFFFADESYNQQYNAEEKLSNLFIAASAIAIVIACLGLFGLAAFAAKQRVKEIGIRKVLGASVGNIVQLLSTDFIKLVAVAIVIASPFAWYIMHRWLMDFAYRVSISVCGGWFCGSGYSFNYSQRAGC